MSCYVQLHRGTGLVSSLIRWQQRGQYAHASILINGTVYEAVSGDGVRAISVQGYEAEYRAGRIVTAPLTLDPSVEAALELWLQARIGAGYDYPAILRFLTRSRERKAGRWFCSELVVAALQTIGLQPFANTAPWEVSPGLLARTPLLEFTGWTP